jgi:AraC family transcriptional regulator
MTARNAPYIEKISVRDRRLVVIAREILLAEFAAPPDLARLARRVGTNTPKLCELFKGEFGKTVAEFVRDVRLERAPD